MKALIITDLQKDFCPGGMLPIDNGDKIVPVINSILQYFDIVVAGKIWHSEASAQHDDLPAHCVENTEGSEFHEGLLKEKIDIILRRDIKSQDDLSVFSSYNEDLKAILKQRKVEDIYIAGLGLERGIKNTALDARKYGFNTYILEDAIGSFNNDETELGAAREDLEYQNITFVHSNRIPSKAEQAG